MTTPFERLVSLLNLRTLTFVLGVCLALAVPSYPALQWLDATLAYLATTLTNDPTYLSWIQGTGPVTATWWLQAADLPGLVTHSAGEIGRASCRERGERAEDGRGMEKKRR